MKFLLCSIVLSFSLLAQAVVPPAPLIVQLFVDKNQDFCLSALDNNNGGAVTTSSCSDHFHTDWIVTNGGPATGTINIFGDKCLDVTNGINKDGTKLQIFTCGNNNKNQQWQVSNDLTIRWTGTNKCLDNTGGALISTGNPTQIWTCGNNNINQKWLPSTPDPNGIAPGGATVFSIPTKATHDSLHDFGCITASSNTDGAPVVYNNCTTSLSGQEWTLSAGSPSQTSTTKGAVGTVVTFGNMCLTVPGGSTANGVKLQVSTCTANNPNQKWTVNGDASIQWAGKNKCVDLTGGSQTFGNQLQSYDCFAGNQNQEWFTQSV